MDTAHRLHASTGAGTRLESLEWNLDILSRPLPGIFPKVCA